jgi:hypothetical protein
MTTYFFQWQHKCPASIRIRTDEYLINLPDPDPEEIFTDPQH